MNGTIHLIQSLKGLWKRLLLLAVIIFLFVMMFTLLGASTHIQTEMLEDLQDVPPVVQKIMGQGFMEAMLKYGIISVGYIHPFMFILFITFIFSVYWQVINSELASGTIGFTLSRAISRKRLHFNAAILTYTGLAFLALTAFFAVWLGITLFHQGKMETAPFLSLSFNIYLLMIFIAGYISLFSAFAETGKSFFTYGGLFLFLLYLLDMAANLWEPLGLLSPLNPFNYYNPMRILTGFRPALGESLGILAVSAIMFTISAFLFNRRDLPSG